MDLYYEGTSAVVIGIATDEDEADLLCSETVSITCRPIIPGSYSLRTET